MNYQEATEYLDKGRDKHSRPLANNTRLERRETGIAVRLHATDVATFRPDGGVSLLSGGWRTVTTKERMNNALPRGWRLFSEKGSWYLHFGGWDSDSPNHLYQEYVTVWPDGRIEGAGKESDKTAEDRLRKRIGAYAKAFASAIVAGKVTLPGAGDCWYCGVKTVEDDKPLGDAFSDTSHLDDHMKEKYFVPSLVFNAFEDRGQSIAMKSSLRAKCSGDPSHDWNLSYFEKDAAKTIRKYMLRRFGLSA